MAIINIDNLIGMTLEQATQYADEQGYKLHVVKEDINGSAFFVAQSIGNQIINVEVEQGKVCQVIGIVN